MGCCVSSAHSGRRYRDPADLDEEIVPEDALPLRTFGQFRNSTVFIPDDIPGLPSTHLLGSHLATDTGTLLYEAEIDNGRAFRCVRVINLLWFCPCSWVYIVNGGLSQVFNTCTCDETCCWLRKEYSTRVFYRVYPNAIKVNNPLVRFPWGCCACGSWNADDVLTHPFDRGAFGFRRVSYGVFNYLCLIWPVYGDAVARQRCPCNGPLWKGGWWCEEWPCDMLFCTYKYYGIADGDEAAFASGLALQAYFEGRKISREDMDKCLEYWRTNISEMGDPINRKRSVMCEPFCVPFPSCSNTYKFICQIKRTVPYKGDDTCTEEVKEIYDKYEELRQKQIKRYETFKGPLHHSTVCRTFGCRRVFGRKGLIFCTEGCWDTAGCCYSELEAQEGIAPPFAHPDIDDDNDAAKVLQAVLGNPPPNVVYKRWERNSETGKFEAVTYPAERKEAASSEIFETPLVSASEKNEGSLVQRLVSSSGAHTEGVEVEAGGNKDK